MSATVQQGLPWSVIAESAYKAYCAFFGGKEYYFGDQLKPFDELPLPIRTAWEAAVRQAGDCLKRRLGQEPPDESFWNGWVKP